MTGRTALGTAPLLVRHARGAHLRRLPLPAKARLVAEIGVHYVRLRRRLTASGLPGAMAAARAPGAPAPVLPVSRDLRLRHADALRLARAVDRTLERLPVDARCLMRALVLCGLLARRGVESTLVIGVQPGQDFGAHAWIELDGRPLQPTGDGAFGRLVEL